MKLFLYPFLKYILKNSYSCILFYYNLNYKLFLITLKKLFIWIVFYNNFKYYYLLKKKLQYSYTIFHLSSIFKMLCKWLSNKKFIYYKKQAK